ncbi:MAG: AIPR family protein [Rhizobacter sp.]
MGTGLMVADIRPLEVQQIEANLKAEFGSCIVGLGTSEQDRERNFLSKALAAFFLMAEAGATQADAVAASIDGGNDHGIDSVYISPTNVLWLVQSKYIHAGKGEPLLGDASKFKDGVVDFVACRFARFNAALNARQVSINAAMRSDYQLRFALVYTGTSLHDDRLQLFHDVEQSINTVHRGRAKFVRFGLSDCHEVLAARHAEASIEAEIELRNFGLIEAPARAYYGVMRVRDLAALYQQHGHALVRANIRRYRGSSAVNAEITRTLTEAPDNFVYFNNGITLLCDKITPVGAMDAERRHGRFKLAGVSIINGAQTAGTVAQQPLAHYDTHPADVLVTCIQSAHTEEAFGDLVTEYRNSQNAVQPQDFIALNDMQETWRRALQIEGVTYLYKPGASDPVPAAQVFTAQEAACYLAFALRDGRHWATALLLAVQAPERLWDRRQGFDDAAANSIYATLFSDQLSARQLWRTTQIGRLVRQAIESDAASLPEEHAALARETLALATHLVLTRQVLLLDAASLALSADECEAVSRETDAVRHALNSAYQQQDWGGQSPAQVLADASNLRTLKAAVMRELAPAQ